MNRFSLVPFLFSALLVASQGDFTTKLNIQQCTSDGCKYVPKRIALDVDSNNTASSGEDLIIVSGQNSDRLTLKYGGSDVGGPRVYMIEEEGVNKNEMFILKGNEFTFDVSLSTMGCGFNAALYFVGMTANEGGAEKGTGYCDAQAVAGTFCSEMDVMEANTRAQQYTTHACINECGSFSSNSKCKGNGQPKSVCDQSGCGLNPFRYGPGTTYDLENDNPKWYGPRTDGTNYTLDSTQLYTVVTQFNEDSSGTLSSITRFYLQNGNRVDLPTLYVLPPNDGSHMGAFTQPSITKGFCGDIYDRWDGDSSYTPLAQMGKNMESGMVLAMSAWYAKETYVNGKPQGSQTGMSWLDGVNNWGKFIKAGPCDTTTSDDGVHFATFSDIRFGPIGTTVPDAPPSPTPSPPTPPPKTGQCCYNGCSSCQGGWCGQSKQNCENNCNGKWCPNVSVDE